jgi:hypothetical protein
MPKTEKATLESALRALARPIDYDTLLAKVGQRDRTNIDRHVAACEVEPQHAKLWRRLVCILNTLAPLAINTIGQQAVQFFVADGKYRMQVFALEDQRDGKLLIYLPDTLDAAIKQGVLAAPKKRGEDEPSQFEILAKKGETLALEQLNATNTPNPPAHVKHMIGWNRKALRVTLVTLATPGQVTALESLLALAAQGWSVAAVPPTPVKPAAAKPAPAKAAR